MRITFLGTGTSIGVPVIGCRCKVCRSRDRRNYRQRCSLLIQTSGRNFLIDTSPDFRSQALKAGICSLEAVLWTHPHADHLHGVDDLRPLTWGKEIPTYCSVPMAAELKTRFSYVWNKGKKGMSLNAVAPGETISFRAEDSGKTVPGIQFTGIPLIHGDQEILGWRCGPVAYLTDVSEIPRESYSMLENLELLILGALRFESHHKHFTIDQAIRETGIIQPEKCYLTHISHEVSHRRILQSTPAHIRPAYDGLVLGINI